MISLRHTSTTAIKVIASCETEHHLPGTSTYVTLLTAYFTQLGSDNQLIEIYYSELKSKILTRFDESQ